MAHEPRRVGRRGPDSLTSPRVTTFAVKFLGCKVSQADAMQARRALLAAVLALIIGMWWALAGKPSPERALAQAQSSREDSADAGTSGLGDAATSLAMEKAPVVTLEEGLSEDTLPQPQPGQMRPDEKGQCPLKGPVALNKGCWWETTEEPEKCQERGGQMFKGVCYEPIIPPGRKHPPTSEPVKNP